MPARDARGRFVPARVEAPVSTLTLPQRAAAVLVGDFLAVVIQRIAEHLGADDERRRQQADERRRAFHDARRQAHRQLGPYERRNAR